MTNAILAIDLVMGLMEASLKIQEVLRKAQAEGRDVTPEELTALRTQNALKATEFLSE